MIKTAHINILETGTVTLDAGTEDSSYPLYRTYDRHVGRLFKTTSAVTTEVKVDQGGTGNLAVDRLLIPAGHNLSGMTLDITHSDDDALYTAAVAQWTGAAGVIDKSWASLTKRYWKFIITSPASIPEIPELFLTATYAWMRDPTRPTGALEREGNVENAQTVGGKDRFLVQGPSKLRREYSVPRCGQQQMDNMLSHMATHQAGKPFWLHDGTQWIYGKLRRPLEIREIAYQTYSYNFDFLEVLP
jgi:hypothetical protein